MEGQQLNLEDPIIPLPLLLEGRCLLCLIKVEPGDKGSGSPTSSSFQYLANYLRVASNDVEILESRRQPNQLEGERSRSKFNWNAVTLCEGCALLSEKIWALHEQLERIKLEMASCLEMVQGRIRTAEETGLMTKLFQNRRRKSKKDKLGAGLGSGRGRDNLEDVERLRREVKDKCSIKLSHFPPQVQLQKMTGTEVDFGGRRTPDDDDDMLLDAQDVDLHCPIDDNDNDLDAREDTPYDNLLPAVSSSSSVGNLGSSSSTPLPILPRPHKCDLCSKAFTTSKNLGKHRRIVHFKSRKYSCRHCSKRFEFNYNLRDHLMSAHSELLNTEEDNLQPGVSSEYSTVVIVTTPTSAEDAAGEAEAGIAGSSSLPPPHTIDTLNPSTGRHDCPQCSEEFKDRQAFYYHYNSIHLNIRFQCTLCSQLFKSRRDYRRHHQVEHMKLSFTCHKCGRLFRKSSSFYEHLRRVKCEDGGGRKKFRCPHSECDKGCRTQASLEAHIKRDHLKLKEYICEHCAQTFSSTRNMNKHITEIHSRAKEYICELCAKVFYRKDGLTRHLKTVHPGVVMVTATAPTTSLNI